MSEPGVDVVVGYVTCATCPDAWVAKDYASSHGGQCPECFVAGGRKIRRHLEVVGRGTTVKISTAKPRKKVRTTPKNKQLEKAKDRARKRLAATFPDFYQILLAEERAAIGLPPYPKDWDARCGPDPSGEATGAFAALYHRLEQNGIDT